MPLAPAGRVQEIAARLAVLLEQTGEPLSSRLRAIAVAEHEWTACVQATAAAYESFATPVTE